MAPTKQRYAALQTFKGVVKLDANEDTAQWNGQESVRTFHVFVNETSEPVDLVWFWDGVEHYSGTIAAGSNLYVGTYTFHQWKVKSQATGQLLGLHTGQSATVTVRSGGCAIAYHPATADDPDNKGATRIDSAKGVYALRSHALGLPVWAFECVPDDAVQRAVHIATRMLEGVPAALLTRMLGQGAALGIFGRDHVVTDLPPHAFMRHNANRDLNATSRGLGGTPSVPVTSCGEENLTMEDDHFYPCQSILVHELGHAVMNLGMPEHTRTRLEAAYNAAVRDGLYPDACYMVVNDHEYFATGTEAWFESTIRTDVNGGVNTRAGLKTHDPRLAAVMAEMFGDGAWRYHHDCPRPLSFHRSGAAPVTSNSSSGDAAITTTATTGTPGTSATAAPVADGGVVGRGGGGGGWEVALQQPVLSSAALQRQQQPQQSQQSPQSQQVQQSSPQQQQQQQQSRPQHHHQQQHVVGEGLVPVQDSMSRVQPGTIPDTLSSDASHHHSHHRDHHKHQHAATVGVLLEVAAAGSKVAHAIGMPTAPSSSDTSPSRPSTPTHYRSGSEIEGGRGRGQADAWLHVGEGGGGQEGKADEGWGRREGGGWGCSTIIPLPLFGSCMVQYGPLCPPVLAAYLNRRGPKTKH